MPSLPRSNPPGTPREERYRTEIDITGADPNTVDSQTFARYLDRNGKILVTKQSTIIGGAHTERTIGPDDPSYEEISGKLRDGLAGILIDVPEMPQ